MRFRSPLTIPREFCRNCRVARWQLLIGVLVAATIWCLVDVRRRGYASPEAPAEHKSDLTVYTESGAAFFDGRPPYAVCNPRGWTYVYPPLFAMLLAAVALFAHAGPGDRLVLRVSLDVLGQLPRKRGGFWP